MKIVVLFNIDFEKSVYSLGNFYKYCREIPTYVKDFNYYIFTGCCFMGIPDVASTSCAFIPVYCYYDENAGEVKTPILLMDNNSLLLKAIVLELDPNIFTYEELKDQFIEAYYSLSSNIEADSGHLNSGHLNSYDIYPQLVTVLHTDSEEISIYICELYENTEYYFKKQNRSNVAELVSYKEGIDELISGGALEPLTEKILVTLSEEDHLTSDNKNNSIELF